MLTGPRVVNARPQLGDQAVPGCVLFPLGAVFAVLGGFGALSLIRKAMIGDGDNGLFIGIAVTCLFMLVGLSILWHLFTRDAPSPAATAAKAHAPLAKCPVLPTVSVRPGPNGGVAIRPAVSPLGSAIGLGIFGLIWNGFVWAIGFSALSKGNPLEIPVVIVMALFGLIGLAILGGFVHSVLKVFVTGETVVELDREPVPPGHLGRLRIMQRSRVPVDHLVVKLVCEEVYSYGSGSDRVTKREPIYSEVLVDSGNVQTDPTRPFVDATFRIPPDAAPSFHASDNEICWSIHVKMVIPARPDVDDSFRFRVVPTV